MSTETLKTILNDESLTDDQVSVLMSRAEKLAVNQRFWHKDDNPTDEELEAFYSRYEFEIYDIAKAINDSGNRDGLRQYTELGITRVWGESGNDTVYNAVSAIPPKTYLI